MATSPTTSTTNQPTIKEIEFLVSGSPKEGHRISDVSAELKSRLEATVAGWNSFKKGRKWFMFSDIIRCVDVRVRGLNKQKTPIHKDAEHKTACKTCINAGKLCMLVLRRSQPVILPLPEEKRAMDVTPRDVEYYFAKKNI
jgi:hypothetical protein